MKTISNFALWLPKLKIVFIKENQSSPFVFLTMCKSVSDTSNLKILQTF